MDKTVKIKVKKFLGIILFNAIRNIFRSLKYFLRYHRIFSRGSRLSDIQVISIEFCSICNLKCRYCHLERDGRPAFLDIRIYEKLLDELCKDKGYSIKIMEWPISGCFFLHPRYKEIVLKTAHYKNTYVNFKPWIILNDNMMLFDYKNADFIIGSKVVNQIICSIDGVDRETFERMRPGADFDTVIKNTEYLLDRNKSRGNRITIQINNGLDDFCKNKKIEPRLKRLLALADRLTQWNPLDWNESFHTDAPHFTPGKKLCSFVFESVTLSSSGSITKCCMDLREKTKYGDFNNDSLESIWLSEERRRFLREMYKGNRDLIPGCRTCSIGYVSQNRDP